MAIHITLKEVAIFNAITQQGSVQNAANLLGLTQSAASQALLKLEQRLSRPLFDRVGKKLLINENGRIFLPHAQALLDNAVQLEHLFTNEQVISLKIGASTTIANYIMPYYLAQFRQTYPNANFDMVVGNTDLIIQSVLNFDIDVGLIEGHCYQQELQQRIWQQDELVIFSAPNYFSSSDIISIEQLKKSPWLLREQGSGTRDIVEHFLNSHLGGFNLNMELGNSEAIKHSVAVGLGISCLSRYVINDLLQQNKLIEINCELPKLTRNLSIITHKRKRATFGMTTLMNMLKNDTI